MMQRRTLLRCFIFLAVALAAASYSLAHSPTRAVEEFNTLEGTSDTKSDYRLIRRRKLEESEIGDVEGGDGSTDEAQAEILANFLCRLNVNIFGCVCNEAGLRAAVAAANDAGDSGTTNVRLCHNSRVALNDAVDVSGKKLEISCNSRFTFLFGGGDSSCSINGQGRTRLFVGSSAKITISGVRLANGAASTVASDRDGGAIRLTGNSLLTLDRCVLSGNQASSGAGGAIAVTGGSVFLKFTVLRNNVASDGGALAASNSIITLNNCIVDKNTGTTAAGALILNGGTATIISSSLTDNMAQTVFGGAMAVQNTKISLIDSSFSGNEASSHSASSDIYIADDNDPAGLGTSVTCTQTVFCDGLGGIFNVGTRDNTNCDTVGLTSGSSCPA